jgi:hypothetical protein
LGFAESGFGLRARGTIELFDTCLGFANACHKVVGTQDGEDSTSRHEIAFLYSALEDDRRNLTANLDARGCDDPAGRDDDLHERSRLDATLPN